MPTKHADKLITVSLLVLCFALAAPALAGVITPSETGLEETAGQAGLPQTSITDVVSRIINALMAVLGVIFFILLIVGGILWMTASGNEEKVKKAKSMITSAIIGLVIVLSAYAIASYVINVLIGTSTPAPTE